MKKFILWQKFKSITPSTRTMLLRRGLKFAVVFFIFTKVFPPPGFCAASFSFPSDEDYIVFSLGKLDPEIVKLDKGDTTAKNYYKNHPDCCYVNRWGGWDVGYVSSWFI